MRKNGSLLLLTAILFSCAPGQTRNGMRWQEFYAAKYNLRVTYRAEEVADCRKLGFVRGTAYVDIGASKEAAIEQAVLLGGDTLYFERLWSELLTYRLVGPREIFYADGKAYRCQE